MKRYLISLLLGLFFIGCQDTLTVENSMANVYIPPKKQSNLSDDIFGGINKDIYFVDSKHKKYYLNRDRSGDNITQRVNVLLDNLFYKAKRKFRKRRIYVSLIVKDGIPNRQDIMNVAQRYLINHRRYVLTTTDRISQEAIKKTLNMEKDAIYQGDSHITFKHKSDVILSINATNNTVYAKLLLKNKTSIATNSIGLVSDWISVKVPTNSGGYKMYQVMIKPVVFDKNNKSRTNIPYNKINDYCESHGAEIMDLYVFEYARRARALQMPSSNVNLEIMASYDEDIDGDFYRDGDEVEVNNPDETAVVFNWKKEEYYATSKLFKSKNATFRCMKEE